MSASAPVAGRAHLVPENRAFADIPVFDIMGARDLPPANVHPAVEFITSPKVARKRDPLYLFACKIEWRNHCNLTAFQELLAALDDPSEETRLIAESLLGRPSPRRKHSDL